MRRLLLALPLVLCACGDDSFDDPFYEPGECSTVGFACVSSCLYKNDYSRYKDAVCKAGELRCPAGTRPVDDCN